MSARGGRKEDSIHNEPEEQGAKGPAAGRRTLKIALPVAFILFAGAVGHLAAAMAQVIAPLALIHGVVLVHQAAGPMATAILKVALIHGPVAVLEGPANALAWGVLECACQRGAARRGAAVLCACKDPPSPGLSLPLARSFARSLLLSADPGPRGDKPARGGEMGKHIRRGPNARSWFSGTLREAAMVLRRAASHRRLLLAVPA